MRKAAMAVLLLTLTVSAHALDLTGRELFIPIAGRTPGGAGTFWQTDLVITSLSPEYDQLRVRVDFYANGAKESFDVEVRSGESAVIEDFVRTKLGRDTALGTIHLTVTPSDAQIKAEAVVHNVGGDELLGQTVNALPLGSLQTRSLIGGLLFSGGHRSNIGVANPHDEPVQVRFTAPHGLRPRNTITLAPHAYVQMDAFNEESPTVLVSADKPVYAYGSVIRGGDGDPQFVLPVEIETTSTFVIAPACSNAAPLNLSEAPAPGWIVVYKDGVESDVETPRLIAKYGFAPRFVYSAALEGFGSELSHQQLAAIRCEPTVQYIEQNHWIVLGRSKAAELK